MQYMQQHPTTTVPARAAPQRGYVGRHLANVIRVSGSDIYALIFLFSKWWKFELTGRSYDTQVYAIRPHAEQKSIVEMLRDVTLTTVTSFKRFFCVGLHYSVHLHVYKVSLD